MRSHKSNAPQELCITRAVPQQPAAYRPLYCGSATLARKNRPTTPKSIAHKMRSHKSNAPQEPCPTRAVHHKNRAPATSGVSAAPLWERNSCAKQTIQQHQTTIAHKMRSHKYRVPKTGNAANALLWERNSCAKKTFQQHQNQSRIRCAPTRAVHHKNRAPATSDVPATQLWERNSCAKKFSPARAFAAFLRLAILYLRQTQGKRRRRWRYN